MFYMSIETSTANLGFTNDDFLTMGVRYARTENDPCIICLEAFKLKDKIAILGCGHIVCHDCCEGLESLNGRVSNCSECRRLTKVSCYFSKENGSVKREAPDAIIISEELKNVLLKIPQLTPDELKTFFSQFDFQSINDQELVMAIVSSPDFNAASIEYLKDAFKNDPTFMLGCFTRRCAERGVGDALEMFAHSGYAVLNDRACMEKVVDQLPQDYTWIALILARRTLSENREFVEKTSQKILGEDYPVGQDVFSSHVKFLVMEKAFHSESLMTLGRNPQAKFIKRSLANFKKEHLAFDSAHKTLACKFLAACHPEDAWTIFECSTDDLKQDQEFREACYQKAQMQEGSLMQELLGISFEDMAALFWRYAPVWE
jgi:hypothetical protein